MGVLRAQDRDHLQPFSCPAAHLALGAIRQLAAGTAGSAWPAWMTFVLDPGLQGAVCLLRAADALLLARQGVGLNVAPPGPLPATRHERRLLRAIAAAQVGAGGLVDNFLFKLAPSRQVRPALARAVTALAAGLSDAGYLFPDFLLPAPALAVVRLRGQDLHGVRIAWPDTAPSDG